jgi:hypothetical protein
MSSVPNQASCVLIYLQAYAHGDALHLEAVTCGCSEMGGALAHQSRWDHSSATALWANLWWMVAWPVRGHHRAVAGHRWGPHVDVLGSPAPKDTRVVAGPRLVRRHMRSCGTGRSV